VGGVDFFQIVMTQKFIFIINGVRGVLFQFFRDIFNERTPFGSWVQLGHEKCPDSAFFLGDKKQAAVFDEVELR
jgi:hypothetical protein